MDGLVGNIVFGKPTEPFRWQTLDGWYAEGAARYFAHARRQLADGQCEHAGCSLQKAAHKARQARAVRDLMGA